MNIDINEVKNELARRNLIDFTARMMPEFEQTEFHCNYYKILDAFAKKKIKRLIITIPPQHGKSLGSTIMLPSFILGRNPNTKIAIGSYSSTFAKKFNREVQRIIDTKIYNQVFKETSLNSSNVVTVASNYLRNSEEFEIVNYKGGLKAVGRGGALTGNPVDVMIMDDLYKDAAEGNSPLIRDSVWDWYTSVVLKRLHNDSQQLIVFTRWHEDDLIGRLEKQDKVIIINSFKDIEDVDVDFDGWFKVNFEAIKTGEPTEIDKREKGEALYPKKHNIKKLIKERNTDPEKFECMNQGNPESKEGYLYDDFKTYKELPELKQIKNYTDTADTGKDYLCSINYGLPVNPDDDNIYVLDILYTDEPMEITEEQTAEMITKRRVGYTEIESNNGGRGFARAVDKLTPSNCVIDWFTQNSNKESRIHTNKAAVNKRIVFPENWHIDYPEFYNHLTRYKKMFRANKQDGAPDVLTGIIERNEITEYWVI